MKKKNKIKKEYDLDTVANYMSKVELGEPVTIDEIDTIGEYIDEKLNENNDDPDLDKVF